MSDFHKDNAWQRDMRDRVLAPGFYGEYAVDGRYVFIDKGRLATRLQREYAVDTVIQGKDGRGVFIEEKIVRWPRTGRAHTAFALETHSCTTPGREKDGWMLYGKADYLLYAFAQPDDSLKVYVIDFPKLGAWFWPLEDTFNTFTTEQINQSLVRLVPIDSVTANVPTRFRHVGVRCEVYA